MILQLFFSAWFCWFVFSFLFSFSLCYPKRVWENKLTWLLLSECGHTLLHTNRFLLPNTVPVRIRGFAHHGFLFLPSPVVSPNPSPPLPFQNLPPPNNNIKQEPDSERGGGERWITLTGQKQVYNYFLTPSKPFGLQKIQIHLITNQSLFTVPDIYCGHQKLQRRKCSSGHYFVCRRWRRCVFQWTVVCKCWLPCVFQEKVEVNGHDSSVDTSFHRYPPSRPFINTDYQRSRSKPTMSFPESNRDGQCSLSFSDSVFYFILDFHDILSVVIFALALAKGSVNFMVFDFVQMSFPRKSDCRPIFSAKQDFRDIKTITTVKHFCSPIWLTWLNNRILKSITSISSKKLSKQIRKPEIKISLKVCCTVAVLTLSKQPVCWYYSECCQTKRKYWKKSPWWRTWWMLIASAIMGWGSGSRVKYCKNKRFSFTLCSDEMEWVRTHPHKATEKHRWTSIEWDPQGKSVIDRSGAWCFTPSQSRRAPQWGTADWN